MFNYTQFQPLVEGVNDSFVYLNKVGMKIYAWPTLVYALGISLIISLILAGITGSINKENYWIVTIIPFLILAVMLILIITGIIPYYLPNPLL